MAMSVDAFVEAAKLRDAVTIKQGLTHGRVDVNAYDTKGWTALHGACLIKENEEVFLLLIKAGADVNMTTADKNSLTPLLVAVRNNAGLGVVKKLVSCGASVLAVDKYMNYTALHPICKGYGKDQYWNGVPERIAMADFLLKHGAAPCLAIQDNKGRTPYDMAMEWLRHTDMPNFLVEWAKNTKIEVPTGGGGASNASPSPPPSPGGHGQISRSLGLNLNGISAFSGLGGTGESKTDSMEAAVLKKQLAEEAAARKEVEHRLGIIQKLMADEIEAKTSVRKQLADEQAAKQILQNQLADQVEEHKQLLDRARLQLHEEREAHAATQNTLSLVENTADQHEQRIKELEVRSGMNTHFNAMKDSDFTYSEEDLLGEGENGRVFKARYFGADVAVKFFKTTAGDEKQADINFMHELGFMQRIPAHPNVVGFIGASVSTRPLLLGMTLMRGSLETLLLIRKECPLEFGRAQTEPEYARLTLRSLKDTVWYLIGASCGLLQLHSQNVVHCDVAARNFLVDFGGHCCIADFGMCHALPEGFAKIQAMAHSKIPLAWTAPESIIKREWSAKTDVYGFGVLMVEVLTRNEPYPNEEIIKIAPKICDERQPYRPKFASWWPQDLSDLARECMSHKEKDRPTMAKVYQRLQVYHDKLNKAQLLKEVYQPGGSQGCAHTKVGLCLMCSAGPMSTSYKVKKSSEYYVTYHAPAEPNK